MSFSWQEADELKKQCAQELRKNKHRSMRHGKKRKTQKIFQWQDVTEKDVKKLGYSNYEEWKAKQGLEFIDPLEANPDLLNENGEYNEQNDRS